MYTLHLVEVLLILNTTLIYFHCQLAIVVLLLCDAMQYYINKARHYVTRVHISTASTPNTC